MTDPQRPDPALDATLQDAVRRLVDEARTRVVRAAADGRSLLRMRQLQKERDALCVRLGKTAHRLVEAGEIAHPALTKGVERLDALDAELDALREALGEDAALADPRELR